MVTFLLLQVCVCIILLYQLVNQGENIKYLVAVACTLLLCLLVLITATLDNVSWWSSLFPSAFMTEEGVTDLLNRLSVAEPGYKVTVQQGEARALSASQSSQISPQISSRCRENTRYLRAGSAV